MVEQPFASVDNRIVDHERCHSVNYWLQNGKVEHCGSDTLRLLNEVEKQLAIGSASWTTFDRIRSMQPIRRWLATNVYGQKEGDIGQDDLLKDYAKILSAKKQWTQAFFKCVPSNFDAVLSERILRRVPPPAPFIPWRLLLETQQENPFKSQSTLAWYSLGCMFNHSCLPNCVWYLIGDYLVIYVCGSTVKPGDELTISYCPLWIPSLSERSSQLLSYGIHSCQCSLCSYDRRFQSQQEGALKKLSNIQALARQKNLSTPMRWKYFQKFIHIYEAMEKQYADRPIGFVHEFADLESVLESFQDEKDHPEIMQFLNERRKSFLQRFASACRLTTADGPRLSNPICLMGFHLQVHLHVSDWQYICQSLVPSRSPQTRSLIRSDSLESPTSKSLRNLHVQMPHDVHRHEENPGQPRNISPQSFTDANISSTLIFSRRKVLINNVAMRISLPLV